MFEVDCELGLDITHVMKMIFMISHGFDWSHICYVKYIQKIASHI
jgi:hypothetical protein